MLSTVLRHTGVWVTQILHFFFIIKAQFIFIFLEKSKHGYHCLTVIRVDVSSQPFSSDVYQVNVFYFRNNYVLPKVWMTKMLFANVIKCTNSMNMLKPVWEKV